jgi:TP901 family phage tail tape measure protein
MTRRKDVVGTPQADGSILVDAKLNTSNVESSLSKLSSMAGAAAAAFGLKFGADAAIGLGKAIVSLGSEFYAKMSEVAAISGATGEAFDALTEKAKELGANTQFSAYESAEALTFMAAAGWDTTQMVDGIAGVMDLAAASGESLARASEIVTDALTALGMSAGESAHFADVLAMAAAASNTSVGLMGETFKYVAPLAGALGYNAEDLSVAIGLMANAGIKGSQAGTALRGVFTRLASPSKQVAEVMDSLGISLTDQAGVVKPLSELMLDLRMTFEKLTPAEQAAAAAAIGGQAAMSGLLAVVNASQSDFDGLMESMYNADGAAQEMARTLQDNLKGDVEQLGGALEGLGLQIFDAFNTQMRVAVQEAEKAVGSISEAFATPLMQDALKVIADAFANLIEGLADFAATWIPKVVAGLANLIKHFDEIALVITPLLAGLLAYKAVTGVMTTVQSAITGVKAAMTALNAAALANPIAALVAVVAAFGVAIYSIHKATQELKPDIKELQAQAKAFKDEFESIQQSSATSADAFEKQRKAISANKAEVADMQAKLNEFANTTSLTAEQQKELQIVMERMNSLLPGLQLEWDGQTNSYNIGIDALNAYIEQYKQGQAEIETLAKRQKELQAERDAASVLRDTADERIVDIKERLAVLSEEMSRQNALTMYFSGNLAELNELKAELGQYKSQFEEASVAVTAHEAALQEVSGQLVDAKAKTAEFEQEQARLAASAQKASQNVTDWFAPTHGDVEATLVVINDLSEALDKNAASFSASAKQTETHASLLKSLAQEAANLASKTALTADEEVKLQGVVMTLNGFIPGLSLEYDKQAKSLSKTTDEVARYADAQAASLASSDGLERLSQLYQEQESVALARADAEQSLLKVKNALIEAESHYNGIMDDSVLATADVVATRAALADEIARLTGEQEALTTSIDVLVAREASYAELTQETSRIIVDGEQQVAEALEQGIAVREADLKEQERIADEQKKVAEELAAEQKRIADEKAKALADAENQLADQLQAALDRYMKYSLDALQKMTTDQGVSLKEAVDNLKANQKAMTDWEEDLRKISGRTNNLDFMKWLRDMGPEQSKLIDQLANASEKDFQALEAQYLQGGQNAVSDLQSGLESGSSGVEIAASAIINKVVFGLNESTLVSDAAKKMVDDALGAQTAEVGSVGFEQVGTDIGAKISGGMTADTVATEAAAGMVSGVKTALDAQVTASDFTAVGANIGAAVHEGLASVPENAAAMDGLVSGIKTAMDTQVETANFKSVGTAIGTGVHDGLVEYKTGEEAALTAVANMKTAMDDQVKTSDFKLVGDAIIEDVAAGVTNGFMTTSDAARMCIEEAKTAAQLATDVAGFEALGASIPKMIAAGIQNSTSLVTSALQSLVNAAVSAASAVSTAVANAAKGAQQAGGYAASANTAAQNVNAALGAAAAAAKRASSGNMAVVV